MEKDVMAAQQAYADAMQAFDAYYDARHERFGLAWPGKRYREHAMWRQFEKIAALCAKNGWDISHYVETVLAYFGKGGETTPIDVAGTRGQRVYAEHKDIRQPGVTDQWMVCTKRLLGIQAATGKDDVTVLYSPLYDFPSWFRLFYPETLDGRIQEMWGAEAWEDLRANPGVVKYLRRLSPDKLIELEKKWGPVNGR